MKRLIFIFTALIMCVTSMSAAGKLSIKDITSGKFAAKTVNGINPIEGTDTYARISDDGKRVESYSFKTGKKITLSFCFSFLLRCG